MKENKEKKLVRPPVVVVMGHIDHGKSTILDYIRKANTAEKEAGGITQHVSAYETAFKSKDGMLHKITFLDTPGHEAFSAIRERGSRTADMAVLVVSAEDGVKPQTLEAINWIRNNKMPYLVAINKIDKPNANAEKAKAELAEKEVFLEGWGGNVPFVLVSAKTGEGINELLETLILQAQLEQFTFDPSINATGFVLETKRDQKKGIEATLILKEGSLRKGQFIAAGNAYAPIRSIDNFKGEKIEEAFAGDPVFISGWSEMPQVGSAFQIFDTKKEMEKNMEKSTSEKVPEKNANAEIENKKEIPIIIKADTQGSLDALMREIKKIDNDKIATKIIFSGIGPINESDIKLAKSSNEIIVLGFNIKTDSNASAISLRDNIEVRIFNIIYELTDWLSKVVIERTPEEAENKILGRAQILKTFSRNKNKQVVGGKVEEGLLEYGALVKILRRESEIGEGQIKELQTKKQKIGKVEAGSEFGALIDSKIEIVSGDKIICLKK